MEIPHSAWLELWGYGHFDATFDRIEMSAKGALKRKYKLSVAEQDCFVAFNTMRGISTLYDFEALSLDQGRRLLSYLEDTSSCVPGDKYSPYWYAYLNYLGALWNSRLGHHNRAIQHYEGLISGVDAELARIADIRTAIQSDRARSLTKASAYMLITVGSAAVAASTGGGYYINLMSPAIDEFREAGIFGRDARFYDESELSKGLNIFLSSGEQLQLFRAIGNSYHLTGRIESCLPLHQEAASIVGGIRETIPSESARLSLNASRTQTFDNLVDDLVETGRIREAFDYAERSKARTFLDVLSERRRLEFGEASLNSYTREIREFLLAKEQIRNQISLSNDQVEFINSRQDALLGGLQEQLANDSADDKRHKNSKQKIAAILTAETLDIETIQLALPSNSALLEIYVSKNNVYTWLVTENDLFFYKSTDDVHKLKDNALKLRTSIVLARRNTSRPQNPYTQTLSNALLETLRNLSDSQHIYIVNHRFTHDIPFEILSSGSNLLLDRHQVSYLPSGSSLPYIGLTSISPESLLAFGNPYTGPDLDLMPLSGAEAEVGDISQHFAVKNIFYGEKATRSRFMNEIGSYDVLHIAAHGLFDAENGLDSRIFLAPDKDSDGIVTARDIYSIQKTADLVVLSACETGRSDNKEGDELIGLIRSMFFSGASSVVASRWRIDDEATRVLMKSFYSYLIEDKKTPAEALQLAKLDLRNSTNFSSPYYWAPFSLYGRGT